MSIYTRLFLLPLFFLVSACGVKGKPQPPLEPPTLGRGEMVQNKKTKTDDSKKKKYKSVEPDWEESDDFEDKK